MKYRVTLLIATAVLLLLAATSHAQNLVGYAGATGKAITFTGAPAGTCAWPTGPVPSSFTTLPTVEPCQLPGLPGPASAADIGGVSVKLKDGRHFTPGPDLVNGGSMLGFFEADGTPIADESLAVWGYADITGMAYELKGAKESMYFTDGRRTASSGRTAPVAGSRPWTSLYCSRRSRVPVCWLASTAMRPATRSGHARVSAT